MILLEDVTHYTVGDEVFDRGAIVKDLAGKETYRPRYTRAYLASQETGLPVVAHGPNSTYDRKLKLWTKDAFVQTTSAGLDTPAQIDSLVQHA